MFNKSSETSFVLFFYGDEFYKEYHRQNLQAKENEHNVTVALNSQTRDDNYNTTPVLVL